MAPNAKIYLVEAASSNTTDMMAAAAFAATLPNVHEVSMSWGTTEDACSFVHFDPQFAVSGVVFFGATGDTGGERDYPALSKNVIAVGGSTLNVDSFGNWVSEKVWSGSGCGPSAFEPRPTFQNPDQQIVRGFRGACDLVAVGNPKTGVDIYDSFKFNNVQGWFVVGGTSVSTPVMAGIVNTSGVVFANSQALNTKLYGAVGTTAFHDVTLGTAGGFTAGSGWDIASGLGAPTGLGDYLATH